MKKAIAYVLAGVMMFECGRADSIRTGTGVCKGKIKCEIGYLATGKRLR